MANTIFEQSFTGNQPVILAQQMKFQSIKTQVWGRWTQFNTPKGAAVTPKNEPVAISSPVIAQNELTGRQGDLIKIPMHRNLDKLPKIGKEQLEHQEEDPRINHCDVPVNTERHAEVPYDGKISLQTTKDYKLVQKARPALQRHFTRVLNYLNCSYAMYHGFSWNVLNDTARWGSHSTVKSNSHPHTFIAGSGKVSYGTSNYPGTSGYETQIGTDLGLVGASDVFDTDFLGALKAHDQILKIDPIAMKDGNDLRLILAHPRQIVSLENDDRFRETANNALAVSMAKDNPLLFGAKYIYEGFAIFPTNTAVFPVRVASGKPQWGPATVSDLTSFEDSSSDTMFGAMILGSGALYMALASQMEFIAQMRDYKHVFGIAYDIILGVSRGDFYNRDDGTAGDALVNDASALAVTHVPALTF